MISDLILPEFVGREFLMWLLFRSEQDGGSFELDGEYVNFRVEDQLKLEGEGDVRQTDLKKGVPSISEEARIALRTGKLPTRMRVRLVVGDDEYYFVLDADLLDKPLRSAEDARDKPGHDVFDWIRDRRPP